MFNVFVYGTLRSTHAASDRLSTCEKVADATIGGTLYDIEGRFPALIHYGTDPVPGEVWRCPVEMLAALDEYEGVATGLFRRIGISVETDSGETLPCWMYTAGPALSRHLTPANRVANGIWRARSTPHGSGG